jgi:hypothetical protein
MKLLVFAFCLFCHSAFCQDWVPGWVSFRNGPDMLGYIQKTRGDECWRSKYINFRSDSARNLQTFKVRDVERFKVARDYHYIVTPVLHLIVTHETPEETSKKGFAGWQDLAFTQRRISDTMCLRLLLKTIDFQLLEGIEEDSPKHNLYFKRNCEDSLPIMLEPVFCLDSFNRSIIDFPGQIEEVLYRTGQMAGMDFYMIHDILTKTKYREDFMLQALISICNKMDWRIDYAANINDVGPDGIKYHFLHPDPNENSGSNWLGGVL